LIQAGFRLNVKGMIDDKKTIFTEMTSIRKLHALILTPARQQVRFGMKKYQGIVEFTNKEIAFQPVWIYLNVTAGID
jgi:hypothetical protein